MSSSQTSSSSSERHVLDELVGPLADVTCGVSVQLGNGRVSMERLLSLERNVVLRLTQAAGEDLQVVVNGIAIAHGEIVILDDRTALRVTQLAAPANDEEGA
jgi:flagellar motor switch protein FliN/FliY